MDEGYNSITVGHHKKTNKGEGIEMKSTRKTAIIVGVLYIVGTVAGGMSVLMTTPVRNAREILAGVSASGNGLIWGALFILVMGFSLAMIPVMMFPISKKVNEALALGYVVFRGGLETVTYMAMAISWVLLIPLSLVYKAGTPTAPYLQAAGNYLLESNQLFAICTIVFILGTLMFYYTLYQSKLVPRWLSGWGFIAAVPYMAAGFLGLFGIICSSMSSTSTIHTVMVFPLAVQEMVLAVWLIVKGFNPSTIVSR
jgi:hypothetical protein